MLWQKEKCSRQDHMDFYLFLPSISSLFVLFLYDYLAACSCRVIGPEMPSAELLAAAAKLTEAEAELRSSA